jgi:nicotinate-nucleotide pyrophosphorylase (carboxylating)
MLHRILVEPIVRGALLEDLGRAGDITTDAIVPQDCQAEAFFVAREAGSISGLETALLAFTLLEPASELEILRPSGSTVSAGETIAVVRSSARAILTGERTALNILGRLCGIATMTSRYVAAVAGTTTHIVCTRKTTPGLRALEKEAVRNGGGHNHRFGLDDAVLIKDNHIAVAGGIRPAIERARAHIGHLVKIELEVDTLAQLQEALDLKVDLILLDNMSTEQLKQAVRTTAGRAILEASGSMNLERVAEVAGTGVDLISVGALTHSSRTLDIGLDIRS